MDKQTVTGLVLRETVKGDNDKLLTLLTAERGKLLILGKGVRSLRSRNMTTSQQFSYATYLIARSGNGPYYISESELTESFCGLRDSLTGLSLASYVCDVADHVSVEENPDVPLLRLTLNTLYAIMQKKRREAQIKGAFELRCAAVCGFMPELSGCAVCGATDAPAYYLDILEGELICPNCMARRGRENQGEADARTDWTRPLANVSPELLEILRYVVSSEQKRFLSFELPANLEADFSSVCERYLLHHLGRGFNTLDFYRQVTKV